MDVNTGHATLEDVTFTYASGEDSQNGVALNLTVVNGTATLSRCSFYNFVSSAYTPVNISVTAETCSPIAGKIVLTECKFLGCYCYSTASDTLNSVINITALNADTSISQSSFSTLECTEETETSSDSAPTATGGAVNITCTNSSLTLVDDCSFEYFGSAALNVTSPHSDFTIGQLTVENCTFTDCYTLDSPQGEALSIHIANGTQLIIRNNTLTNTRTPLSEGSSETTCCDPSSSSQFASLETESTQSVSVDSLDESYSSAESAYTDPSDYTYPSTGRAITVQIDNCEIVTLQNNTMEYFTSTQYASSVYVCAFLSSSCGIDTLTFDNNTFISGIPGTSDDTIASFVSIQTIHGEIEFESNNFTTYRSKGSTAPSNGGVSIDYDGDNTSTTITVPLRYTLPLLHMLWKHSA